MCAIVYVRIPASTHSDADKESYHIQNGESVSVSTFRPEDPLLLIVTSSLVSLGGCAHSPLRLKQTEASLVGLDIPLFLVNQG
jgi:CO/xanthine dehydrogenase FAD-binding subunit